VLRERSKPFRKIGYMEGTVKINPIWQELKHRRKEVLEKNHTQVIRKLLKEEGPGLRRRIGTKVGVGKQTRKRNMEKVMMK